jgi:hypothetical protein
MSVEIFKDIETFANAMIEKYFQSLPNDVVSDIGSGWGYMKTKINESGFKW